MHPDVGDDGWATAPQDTRERTCECGLGPLSVLHTLRVARNPDPTNVTVARTYEATVEWTADLSLPEWLRAVAEVCPAYAADRFGPDGGPPRPAQDGPEGAGADGRFRAAPVDATVRPADAEPPGLSDPYHYWNTPLARLLADENYPEHVASLAVDLLEGPEAVWAARATAGVDPTSLPGDRDDYSRVGLEFTARERFRRPADGAADPDEGWTRAGEALGPETAVFAPAVARTMAPAVGESRGETVDRAIRAVEERVDAVWEAFIRQDGDPYAIPGAAVEAATSVPDRE